MLSFMEPHEFTYHCLHIYKSTNSGVPFKTDSTLFLLVTFTHAIHNFFHVFFFFFFLPTVNFSFLEQYATSCRFRGQRIILWRTHRIRLKKRLPPKSNRFQEVESRSAFFSSSSFFLTLFIFQINYSISFKI